MSTDAKIWDKISTNWIWQYIKRIIWDISWSSGIYPRDGRMAPYPQINHCDTQHCCYFSVAQSCLTFCNPMDCTCQASLSFTISWSFLKLMSIESVMPSNRFILCHPLLLLSIFSSIRVFSNESVLCIKWPRYWSFSFSISPSKAYLGLISFRMDWLGLFAV